jgi:dolichol-phosphate mannosyltransferase
MRRFIRFAIVGGTGVVVNYGFYILFHEVLKIFDLLALTLAIELSIINNFILNERWTFRDRAIKGTGTYFKRFLEFNLSSGIVAFSVQVLNQWIETRLFNVWDKASLLVGIILGALANYFICEKLIFKKKIEDQPPTEVSHCS